jgi:Flp pilus assembly protein TadD
VTDFDNMARKADVSRSAIEQAESKAFRLMDQGRAHLDAGRRAEAEDCFRTAARTFASSATLNNYALSRYLAGDPTDALRILTPLLAGSALVPFTRALASSPAAPWVSAATPSAT